MKTAKYKKKCREKVNIRSQVRRELIQYRIQMSKLPCIKPINLVKPQYRKLKQASIIKATSSQIIEASFFKWVKYPGIITIITIIMIMIMMMIMTMMIIMMITIAVERNF